MYMYQIPRMTVKIYTNKIEFKTKRKTEIIDHSRAKPGSSGVGTRILSFPALIAQLSSGLALLWTGSCPGTQRVVSSSSSWAGEEGRRGEEAKTLDITLQSPQGKKHFPSQELQEKTHARHALCSDWSAEVMSPLLHL